MWWSKRSAQEQVLCCTVTPEQIICSLFTKKPSDVPHLARHKTYPIEVPFLIDGQLYNQTLLTTTINQFLQDSNVSVDAYLALDSSVVHSQYIVTRTSEHEPVYRHAEYEQTSMIYVQQQITQDHVGNGYWICSALEQRKYLPFLCAFATSKAHLVAAVPLVTAYTVAFQSVNRLAFQESIEIYEQQMTWHVRAPQGTQTFVEHCTIDAQLDEKSISDQIMTHYGLYVAGKRSI
jgi:hypothetical protein